MSDLSKLTKAQLIALIASQPAGAVKAKTFYTKADIAAGNGFACSAASPCGRVLRTAKRATIHGVDAGGHEPKA